MVIRNILDALTLLNGVRGREGKKNTETRLQTEKNLELVIHQVM